MTTKQSSTPVEAVSAAKDEPAWMLDLRLKAWRFFEEMPWPTGNEETWRRTKLTGFKLDDYQPLHQALAQSAAMPGRGRARAWPRSTASAALAIVDGADAQVRAGSEPGAPGRDLHRPGHGRAASTPSWCSARFNSVVATDENKFSALHYALWNSGTFVYVPRNVIIEQPLQAVIGQSAGKLAGMHHTLVVTEEGAAVTLVEDFIGADGGMTNSVVELLPGANSQVHYLHLQNLADTRLELQHAAHAAQPRQPAALLHRLVGQPADARPGSTWS